MSTTKRIVCLANSRKLSGRCIAGRELIGGNPGAWVRPVSDREHQEVSRYERQYEDGSDPRVLDVIDVPLLEPRPSGYQTENWLLEPNEYWMKVDRFAWEKLGRLASPSAPLWINGYDSFNGENDRVPLDRATGLSSSLMIIRVDAMQLSVFKPGEAFGNPKRRVQVRFRFGDNDYALWVTDPGVEGAYLAREDGEYAAPGAYLTVSLGEPHEGYCYKLVAAVIQRE